MNAPVPFKASKVDTSGTHYLFTGNEGQVFWFEHIHGELNINILGPGKIVPKSNKVEQTSMLYKFVMEGSSEQCEAKGRSGAFMPATPRMFRENIIAFTYHRNKERPCVYLYSTKTHMEVLRVDGALATMHYTVEEEDGEDEREFLIFQANPVLS